MAWYGSRSLAPWSVLIVLALSGCMAAAPGPETRVLQDHHTRFTGDSWVAYHVTIGADATAEFHVETQREGSSLTAFGIWTLHAESGDLDSLFVASTMSPHRETRHLQVATGPGTVFSEQQGGQEGGWGGWAEIRPKEEMELYVVLLAGSDNELEGRFTLEHTDGVALHDEPQTGAARLVTERDFTGTVNLLIEDEIAGQPVHKKVIHDASYPMSTEHRLFGAFKGEVRTGSLEMAYETSGSRTPCAGDQVFPYTCFLSGRSSGDHTLRIIENIDQWEQDDCDKPRPVRLLDPVNKAAACDPPPVVWALLADARIP